MKVKAFQNYTYLSIHKYLGRVMKHILLSSVRQKLFLGVTYNSIIMYATGKHNLLLPYHVYLSAYYYFSCYYVHALYMILAARSWVVHARD